MCKYVIANKSNYNLLCFSKHYITNQQLSKSKLSKFISYWMGVQYTNKLLLKYNCFVGRKVFQCMYMSHVVLKWAKGFLKSWVDARPCYKTWIKVWSKVFHHKCIIGKLFISEKWFRIIGYNIRKLRNHNSHCSAHNLKGLYLEIM